MGDFFWWYCWWFRNPAFTNQLRLVVCPIIYQAFIHPRWCRISSIHSSARVIFLVLLLFIVSNCSSRTKAATELNITLLAIYFVDCEHYASWPSGKLKSLAGKFYHRGNPFLFQCELEILLCTFANGGNVWIPRHPNTTCWGSVLGPPQEHTDETPNLRRYCWCKKSQTTTWDV